MYAIFIAFLFAHQATSEMTLQKIELDKKTAKQYGFSVNYEVNDYGNVFIVAVFPDSTGNNYTSSSSMITIQLVSGNSISFNDYVESRKNSHKTEVIFENEKDFIDASISVVYRCRTDEGMICRGKHYTIKSIRSWKED